jgi:hypothetical protein
MGGEPLSDVEVENHMLKKEIASLNHEIQSIIHRSKDAQEGWNMILYFLKGRENEIKLFI